jgi:hypothetical protein
VTGHDDDARQPMLSCDLVSLALYGAYIPEARHAALPVWRYALEAATAIAAILAIACLFPVPA